MAVDAGLAVELLQTAALAAIFAYLVHRAHQKGLSGDSGWNWILLGLWILLVWSALDVADDLVPVLSSNPTWETLDRTLFDLGPAAGMAALAVGLARWMPYPSRLEEQVAERTEELAESEARFRAIAENVDAAVWLAEMGEDSHAGAEIVYLGPGYEDLFDQSREEVEEAPFEVWLERVHPEDRERVQRELGDADPSDPAFEIEYRIQLPDGEVRWLRTEGFPVEGAEGGYKLLAGISQDVTERRRREQALQDERRYMDRVLDAFPDVVYVLGPDGVLRRWNDSLPEVTGYPDEEIGSMHGTDFFPEEEQPGIAEAIAETFEEGWTRIEAPFLTADGETIPYEFHSATTTAPDGEAVLVGVARDISERRERERRLQEVQRQYESIFENVQEGLWLMDVDGDEVRIERFNPVQEEITGLSTEEVEGKTLEEAFGPELAESVMPNYRRCIEEREAKSYEEELTFGDETRCFHTRLTPVVEDGEVTEIVGSARDVTEARRYEERLRRQRDQLEILNRLVRHDIRNDMTAVVGLTETLVDDAPEDIRDELKVIQQTGEHVVALTETVRNLVEVVLEGEGLRSEPTPLATTLEREVENARRTYPDAEITLEGEVPHVDVQAGPLLGSVFRNILNNAVLHNDKETPQIRVAVDRRDGAVAVRVTDDGPGIPEDHKEELFEPPEDHLTGDASMGLYLVNRVVDAYGGDIAVEDAEPEGTAFTVELDVAGEA